MKFNNVQTLKYPLPVAWQTLRDHLAEIVAAQDDIEYIRVEKRTKRQPDILEVVSTWQSAPSLPGFLKSFIKREMLAWTEDALWDNDAYECNFTITTHYKIEDIKCTGKIKFEAAGTKSTKITYSGTFTITKTPKSSIFMTGFILKAIESVAAKLIANNFSRVVKALGERISKS